ncbi:MAG: nucleotide exchange factor GrpE [Bowdeniella nasicola]|nr:nucleotide exchange factor GrpE [Bowdeniella nasicola]
MSIEDMNAGEPDAEETASGPAPDETETPTAQEPAEEHVAEGPAYAEQAPEEEAEEESNLADLKAENAQLADDLARARAEVYNTSQEYANFVRRSREQEAASRTDGVISVVEALFSVLDDIALAREHDDLTGTFATMATKLENTLEQRFKVTRFGQVGEIFDPELHEALMATPSPDVSEQTIAQVMQPGYRMDERVLRAARVAVHTPQ